MANVIDQIINQAKEEDKEEDKKDDKINVVLKKSTIALLDEVAKKKVAIAIKNTSFDIMNLIRSKRGRGISYDREINYLARVYLAVMDENILTVEFTKKNPQLKKVLDHLNEINHFFSSDDPE
jgi:hypothetical protein